MSDGQVRMPDETHSFETYSATLGEVLEALGIPDMRRSGVTVKMSVQTYHEGQDRLKVTVEHWSRP